MTFSFQQEEKRIVYPIIDLYLCHVALLFPAYATLYNDTGFDKG